MTSLSTITDGETHADVRLGDTFLVSVDRTTSDDSITVRVFHPDAPETVVGEHCFDIDEDDHGTALDVGGTSGLASANPDGVYG